MDKKLRNWQIIGFIFTAASGTLLHFLYDWSGANPIIALISGVNESTWEHMKLLFVPLFVFALIEYRFVGKEHSDYWCIKLTGTLLGLLLIPALYYGYTGAFGVSVDWFNISIFYITAAAVFLWEYAHFGRTEPCFSPKLCFIVFVIIALAFAVFTFAPPHIPLFRDPITLKYGRV